VRFLSTLPVLLLATIACAQNAGAAPATAVEKGIISGTVVRAETGEPLAGMEVSISSTAQRDMITQVVAGSDGRFSFKDVSRGKYSLIAQGQGYSPQAYQQHGQYSTAIAVGPGLNTQNLVFELRPDASISGVVVDEENETVRNGQVWLIERSGSADGKFTTRTLQTAALDDQGRYRFRHLRPGSYLVAVAAQPWYAQDPPSAPQAAQLPVEVESTEKSKTVPTSDAPQSDAIPAANETQDTSLDVTYQVTFYPNATDPEMATPIQLQGGERMTADITLRTVPGLHLTIRNLGKNPSRPTSAFVQQRLFEGVPLPLNARSQQSSPGFIRLSGLPPGRLLVNLQTLNGKQWKTGIQEIDLVTDAEINASEMSSNNVTVEGIVRFSDGTVPNAAYIHFFNRSTGENFGARVSPTGVFALQEAVSGGSVYEVAANVPDAAVQGIRATGAKVMGRSIVFPRTGSVQLTITMTKGLGRIDGTVLRNNTPVSQSMVVLVPQTFEGNMGLVRRDQSDSDGTFSLYQVVPGRYTLVAIANGWDLDWQNPAVLRPYLERGQLVDVTANRTYKVSVAEQSDTNEATRETHINP
jgi:hypothetical protein